jgi:hypothetical protein
MIVCAHIPLLPYTQNPPFEPWSIWNNTHSYVTDQSLLGTLHNYSNLVLWIAGHVHRNTITPQPYGDPKNGVGFWEVETPSLRDFPQQFRRFQIVRTSDDNISIFVLAVDPAANPVPLPDGSPSPALTSRSYAIAAQQIFRNPWQQGPGMNPHSCVYNAELVIQLCQLSPGLQTKITAI